MSLLMYKCWSSMATLIKSGSKFLSLSSGLMVCFHLDSKSAMRLRLPEICSICKLISSKAHCIKIFRLISAKSGSLVLPEFKTATTASLSQRKSMVLCFQTCPHKWVATKILYISRVAVCVSQFFRHFSMINFFATYTPQAFK